MFRLAWARVAGSTGSVGAGATRRALSTSEGKPPSHLVTAALQTRGPLVVEDLFKEVEGSVESKTQLKKILKSLAERRLVKSVRRQATANDRRFVWKANDNNLKKLE